MRLILHHRSNMRNYVQTRQRYHAMSESEWYLPTSRPPPPILSIANYEPVKHYMLHGIAIVFNDYTGMNTTSSATVKMQAVLQVPLL